VSGASTISTEVDTVAVCGGGLIGASMALALIDAGHAVRVHDRDPQVRRGLGALAGRAGGTLTVAETWEEAAAGATLLVAAVPPGAIADVLVRGARVAASDALLTDVAGVKTSVVDAVVAALAADGGSAAHFVGGHPMAGSERSGPEAADGALFSGATWILTPTEHSSDAALARANALVRDVGGRALVLTPDEHDRIVGLVSHLPQLVASVLADVSAEAVGAQRDAVMAVAGPGFRDTTRIAASDPALWLDIIDGNRAAVVAALEAYTERLATVTGVVLAGDQDALGAVLGRASAARRRLLPKGVDAPTRDLVVPLRDRPGEIARITGALGSVGVNIEDLAMRHATAADRGSLLLRVRADDAQRAVELLEASDVRGVLIEGDDPDVTSVTGR